MVNVLFNTGIVVNKMFIRATNYLPLCLTNVKNIWVDQTFKLVYTIGSKERMTSVLKIEIVKETLHSETNLYMTVVQLAKKAANTFFKFYGRFANIRDLVDIEVTG